MLKARNGDRPVGHWEVMEVAMFEANIITIYCAWSQRGASYFVTNCRSTESHEEKHLDNFEDDLGDEVHKEISRPLIRHFLQEVSLVIDKHSRMKQIMFGLERKWLMKYY